jgi:hypothetical protein
MTHGEAKLIGLLCMRSRKSVSLLHHLSSERSLLRTKPHLRDCRSFFVVGAPRAGATTALLLLRHRSSLGFTLARRSAATCANGHLLTKTLHLRFTSINVLVVVSVTYPWCDHSALIRFASTVNFSHLSISTQQSVYIRAIARDVSVAGERE